MITTSVELQGHPRELYEPLHKVRVDRTIGSGDTREGVGVVGHTLATLLPGLGVR